MERILSQEPFTKITRKKSQSIRFITFNVNGVKTVFNYHPWNKFNNDFNAMFNSLGADIITLQELKLTEQTMGMLKNIGHLDDFRSFISLPSTKKGYSGVGLFVRIPRSSAQQECLTVVKAEEGITGWLCARGSDKSYREVEGKVEGTQEEDGHDASIGGYTDITKEEGLELDSQGRCVAIELANNCVVFALYCPANSMGTDEGEAFRMKFLTHLLLRCQNLDRIGKKVVVMGDINVSLDLIDSAEGINDRLMKNLITDCRDGHTFEVQNYEECCGFKTSRLFRQLLNSYVFSSMWHSLLPESEKMNNQFLYDTTRYIQGRRRKMYTVWNTLTSSRQINYGSRIDLILCNSHEMVKSISNADIWPFILGSDHCPVFTDFDLLPRKDDVGDFPIQQYTKLAFEAKNHYKLNKSRDISTLFLNGRIKKRQTTESDSDTSVVSGSTTWTNTEEPQELKDLHTCTQPTPLSSQHNEGNKKRPSSRLIYTSRKVKKPSKPQKPINQFFS